MTDEAPSSDSTPTLEAVILDLCAQAKLGRTLDPMDAAREFAARRGEDELGWRSHLTAVRRAAVALAEAGRLIIYRKGKPVDPRDFRGVYRIGAPRID